MNVESLTRGAYARFAVPAGLVLIVLPGPVGAARASIVTPGVVGGPYFPSNGTAQSIGPFSQHVDIEVECVKGHCSAYVTLPAAGSVPSGTLAQMLALTPTAGLRYHTMDTQNLSGATGGGNDWVADGTQWRPNGYQRIYVDTAVLTGAKQTAEQVIKTVSFQPGLLYKQRFMVEFLMAKSGVTDVMNLASLRFGATGIVTDPQLALSSATFLPAGKRSSGVCLMFESTGPTTLQRRGTLGQVDNGSFISQAAAGIPGTPLAVTDHQVGTSVLAITAGMATAAADSPQVGEIFVTLVP